MEGEKTMDDNLVLQPEVKPENTVETTQPEVKTFKQEEVESLIKGRLGRERQEFAKMLGLEKYDDVKDYAESAKTLKEQFQAKETELVQFKEKASALEKEVVKFKFQIKDEKFKEAMTLAELKKEGKEMDLDTALEEVLKEYPSMKMVSKVGADPNPTVTKEEPVYSKAYLQQFQHIPKFAKLLAEGKYTK